MATINIMIAVDVVTAVATANNGTNPKTITRGLYMIDTTGYLGTAETGNELVTPCSPGDVLVWTVYPIDPGTNIAISGIVGQAVSDQTFQRIRPDETASGTPYYTCVINQGSAPGSTHQYSVNFSISGVAYTYDPFVKIL
jgi:hypothetical protein